MTALSLFFSVDNTQSPLKNGKLIQFSLFYRIMTFRKIEPCPLSVLYACRFLSFGERVLGKELFLQEETKCSNSVKKEP